MRKLMNFFYKEEKEVLHFEVSKSPYLYQASLHSITFILPKLAQHNSKSSNIKDKKTQTIAKRHLNKNRH
jgi:hypothetical protein